jgi:hypothetical protein
MDERLLSAVMKLAADLLVLSYLGRGSKPTQCIFQQNGSAQLLISNQHQALNSKKPKAAFGRHPINHQHFVAIFFEEVEIRRSLSK